MKNPAIFTRTLTTSTVSVFDLVRDEYSKGLEFSFNRDGICTVSGTGTCTDTDIKIQPFYNMEKVTRIRAAAFCGCSSLTSIVIPDSVTSIGDYAFCCCTGLTSIVIPEGVTSIGDCVFAGCTSLTSVSIPNSVTSIGKFAFRGCTSLKNITMGNGISLEF